MKYRWAVQVMTRNSGAISFFCKSKEQAEGNVQKFVNSITDGKHEKIISFYNLSGSVNCMLLSEIISVHVLDNQILLDIHKHEILEHKNIESEIEFNTNNDDSDGK